jgi:hypothetical protein
MPPHSTAALACRRSHCTAEPVESAELFSSEELAGAGQPRISHPGRAVVDRPPLAARGADNPARGGWGGLHLPDENSTPHCGDDCGRVISSKLRKTRSGERVLRLRGNPSRAYQVVGYIIVRSTRTGEGIHVTYHLGVCDYPSKSRKSLDAGESRHVRPGPLLSHWSKVYGLLTKIGLYFFTKGK